MSLCSFGTQLGVPLWWWSGSGSPPGSPCAPPLFLPSHYKVFLTSPATVVPLSPSQSPGLCDCRGTSLDVCTVSHESHSSLLLEISHFFSCCQPAPSLGWCSISLWEHATVETVWHVPGSWIRPLCGQKSCATAWCVPWRGAWGPAGEEQRVLWPPRAAGTPAISFPDSSIYQFVPTDLWKIYRRQG